MVFQHFSRQSRHAERILRPHVLGEEIRPDIEHWISGYYGLDPGFGPFPFCSLRQRRHDS
jgi:hypothetical protein